MKSESMNENVLQGRYNELVDIVNLVILVQF